MKKFNHWLSIVAVMALSIGVLVSCGKKEAPPRPAIIGAWTLTVEGAAFAPHQFVFLEGGVVLTTNPSRVQEKPDGTGVNDSLGMGTWRATSKAIDTFEGTFTQLNAIQGTGTPADTLIVTFRIKVVGDGFAGKAQAALSSNPTELFPATFINATRIKVDETMLSHVEAV